MDNQKFTQDAESLLFSEEFQELRDKLEFREPNIWHILDISKKEILISAFLGWMLNPNSDHSFSADFLKRFLIQSLKTEAGRQLDLGPVNILVMDLTEVMVDTEEWLGARRCDILIRTKRRVSSVLSKTK